MNTANDTLAEDIDSLFVLPLQIIPLNVGGLKRARLIKNSELEGVIELFRDSASGSGQIYAEDLPKVFDMSSGQGVRDLKIIRSLAALSSYDVYSLRKDLRRMEVNVKNAQHLKLSKHKTKELTQYMTEFTKPLIERIYGDYDCSANCMDELVNLFESPSQESAIKNLRKLAADLNVKTTDIPGFLEDYGDIYLSLAFYRLCISNLSRQIVDFKDMLEECEQNARREGDTAFSETCAKISLRFLDIIESVRLTLESFSEQTKTMWDGINSTKYHAMREAIVEVHSVIGASLCALTVKLMAWEKSGLSKRPGAARSKRDFVAAKVAPKFLSIPVISYSDITPWSEARAARTKSRAEKQIQI